MATDADVQAAARRFREVLAEKFASRQAEADAVITNVTRDSAKRPIGATAIINGVGGQIITIDTSRSVQVGDVWRVQNAGGYTTPTWIAQRRLRAAPGAQLADETISLSTPTGLSLESRVLNPLPGSTTQAEIYAHWLSIGHQYGYMRYEVQVYGNQVRDINGELPPEQSLFVTEGLPTTSLARAIDDSQTIVPIDAGSDFPRFGRIQIEGEKIDYTNYTNGTGDSGAAGTGAAGTFTVSTAGWSTNEWSGYCLEDANGDLFPILTNSDEVLAVTGTPATGAWEILPCFSGCTRGVASTSAAAHAVDKEASCHSLGVAVVGLQTLTTYNVRVRAHSSSGAISAWSAWASETTPNDLFSQEGINVLSNADWSRDKTTGAATSFGGHFPDNYDSDTAWGTPTVATGAYGRDGTAGYRLTLDAGDGLEFFWPYPYADWLVTFEPNSPYTASVFFATDEDEANINTAFEWPLPADLLSILVVPMDHDGGAVGVHGWLFASEIGHRTYNLNTTLGNWYRTERTCLSWGTNDYFYLGWAVVIRNNTDHQIVVDLDRPQLEAGVRASGWKPGLSVAGGGAGGVSFDQAGINSENFKTDATGKITSDIVYTGDLAKSVGGTEYTLRPLALLDSPTVAANYDLDSFSTFAKTLVDVSSEFGLAVVAHGLWIQVQIRDSGSASNNDLWVVLSPNDTALEGTPVFCGGLLGDSLVCVTVPVRCDGNGDFYVQAKASGSGTLDIYLALVGYWI